MKTENDGQRPSNLGGKSSHGLLAGRHRGGPPRKSSSDSHGNKNNDQHTNITTAAAYTTVAKMLPI